MSELSIPIDELIPDAANARLHPDKNVQMVRGSLKRFGAARSIVVDKNGVVRAGNATLDAAKIAGITKVRIVKTDGKELIAVQRDDWSETEAVTYAITDNHTGETSEWNKPILAQQLDVLPPELLEVTGFDTSELAELLDEARSAEEREAVEDPGAEIDRAEELREKWKTELGQLWTIPSNSVEGKAHRVLCGDSTKAEDVARLMQGEKSPLMNTDPPYGIDYAAVKNGIPGSGFQNIQEVRGDIENDDLTDGATLQAFLEAMIRAALPHLTENPAFYLWHPMLTQGTFFAAAAAAAADILIHRQIIWVKPHMVLTRSGMYHWKHELCFYGWIRGKPCEWYGDLSQTSVWELGESQQGRLHPTQKPVELFVRPMMNHTRVGEIAYEPFGGSGSQFVAAEQIGRLCYGLEISPKYIAVILERLAGMGLEPELVETV